MRKYPDVSCFALSAIVFSLLILAYCSAPMNLANETPTPTLDIFDDQVDEKFFQNYAKDVNLNQGVTISRIPLGVVLEGPTPSPNYFTMKIFNHSDEPIRFQNQGFGLRTFVYDQESAAWNEVKVQKPFPETVVLPAKTESFDPTVNNKWTIPDDNFEQLKNSEVRIYITGTGEKTGNTYAAYYDLRLAP